jgi:hypothetical protein
MHTITNFTTTATERRIRVLPERPEVEAFTAVLPLTATSFGDSRWPSIDEEPSHIHIVRPGRDARPTALAG